MKNKCSIVIIYVVKRQGVFGQHRVWLPRYSLADFLPHFFFLHGHLLVLSTLLLFLGMFWWKVIIHFSLGKVFLCLLF